MFQGATEVASDELLRVDPASLTAGELSQWLADWDRLRSALEATALDVASKWDASMVWADDGATTGKAWLASRCDMAAATAGALIRDARLLRNHEATRAACERLGTSRVRAMARHVKPAVEDHYTADESMLLGGIATVGVDGASRLGRFWADHADPDGTDPGGSDGLSELHLSATFRGRFDARGSFSGHDGSTLDAALKPIEGTIYASEQATGQLTSPAQRRAQALMMLVAQATATDPDQALPAQPSMGVVVDWDTLLASMPATLDPQRGFAHGPIDPATAQEMACDSIITRILMGPSREVLDVGRGARTPTVAQRKALKVRDGGCTFPDCGRPVAWTHAHHIRWWSHDGPTDLANLTLLCAFHHRLIHRGGFAVERAADGRLEFRRPDGSLIRGRDPDRGATHPRPAETRPGTSAPVLS